MNDNEGTRNFETVQKESESPKGNKNKPDAKKIITISIFALAIAVILLFSAVIITEIVYSINGDKDQNDTTVEFKTVNVKNSDIYNGALILAEGKNDLHDSFDPDIVNIDNHNNGKSPYKISESTSYPSDRLTKETVANLNDLALALKKAKDVELIIAYAYHSAASGIDGQHVIGTVLDIKQVTEGGSYKALENDVLSWIDKNAAKYGFVNSYPNGEHDSGSTEPSTQLRYVGVAHATYMSKNNIDIEEYISKLRNYSKDNMLKISGDDGKSYAVYYVKEASTIDVPSKQEYDISGDNSNGYIITVHLSEEKE